MKSRQLITLLVSAAVLATASGFSAAADKAQDRNKPSTVEQIDLRQEITSPTAGEFTQSGSTSRSGWQQDFGGISGTANGMDGFPTASGDPSTYPAPDGSSSQSGSTGGPGGFSNP